MRQPTLSVVPCRARCEGAGCASRTSSGELRNTTWCTKRYQRRSSAFLPPPKQPTATDAVVASIQKGQQAATSLSKVGGTAPDTELTPQALAEMS